MPPTARFRARAVATVRRRARAGTRGWRALRERRRVADTAPYSTPRHEEQLKALRDARMRAADDASTSAWHAAPNTSPPAGGRPSSPNLHDRYVSMLDAAPAERPPSPSLTSMFDGSGAVLTSAADPRPQGRRRFFVDEASGRRARLHAADRRLRTARRRSADAAAAPERALARSSSHGSLASPRTTPAAAPAARAPLSPRRPSSSARSARRGRRRRSSAPLGLCRRRSDASRSRRTRCRARGRRATGRSTRSSPRSPTTLTRRRRRAARRALGRRRPRPRRRARRAGGPTCTW